MHDGLGFLTMHLALSLRFEQMLQLNDARVSLPYWDFTAEAEFDARARAAAAATARAPRPTRPPRPRPSSC